MRRNQSQGINGKDRITVGEQEYEKDIFIPSLENGSKLDWLEWSTWWGNLGWQGGAKKGGMDVEVI